MIQDNEGGFFCPDLAFENTKFFIFLLNKMTAPPMELTELCRFGSVRSQTLKRMNSRSKIKKVASCAPIWRLRMPTFSLHQDVTNMSLGDDMGRVSENFEKLLHFLDRKECAMILSGSLSSFNGENFYHVNQVGSSIMDIILQMLIIS